MDNYEKARELLNKHLNIHGGDSLGITDGNVYRAVIDAIDEALSIHDVVGQGEQLKCDHEPDRYTGKYAECVKCRMLLEIRQ